MTRQVHNPGDLLLLHWTASAVRLARLALLEYAQKCEAGAKEETNPQVRQFLLYLARQHAGLAEEMRVALDEVKSVEDDTLEGKFIIGLCLERERMGNLLADLKELERRDKRE